ncbi:SHOCT domain-containing protein [Subtercola frigoramans]|uniref:Membrane protein n=1 Tax=Subtercola frigoramans TaxID=120298 RepID=A0ABS2L4E1_9MICO|nr:SHOCT domain-containing protein [Subtercola frigoramans]MBM7471968.1 putative membrane protein [Subtercola frigoramans]
MLTTAVAAAPTQAALAHWGHWGGPGGPGGFGFLFLLIPLFWIGVVILIVSLVSRRRRKYWAANGGHPGWGGPGWGGRGPWGAQGWGGQNSTSDAEKTLADRFARGDIDEVEYRARLEVLQANRPSGPTPPAA